MHYHPDLRTGLSKSALNQGYRLGARSECSDPELSPRFKDAYCKPMLGSLGTVYDSVRDISSRDDLPPLLRLVRLQKFLYSFEEISNICYKQIPGPWCYETANMCL